MPQLIKKNTGDGIVRAVDNGRIIVAPISRDEAASSGAKTCAAGCGSCGGCVPGNADRFRVAVDNADAYSIGDRVRYTRYIPEPNLVSALVFGVPVAFAVAAVLYRVTTAPRSAESTTTLIALAAFIAGIAVIGILDRLFKTKYPPSIIAPHDNDNLCAPPLRPLTRTGMTSEVTL